MSNHTPGPWAVSRVGSSVYAPDDNPIANISKFAKTEEERAANARLIAAAPEMLEALIKIREIADDFYNKEMDPIFRLAEIAIHKATACPGCSGQCGVCEPDGPDPDPAGDHLDDLHANAPTPYDP